MVPFIGERTGALEKRPGKHGCAGIVTAGRIGRRDDSEATFLRLRADICAVEMKLEVQIELHRRMPGKDQQQLVERRNLGRQVRAVEEGLAAMEFSPGRASRLSGRGFFSGSDRIHATFLRGVQSVLGAGAERAGSLGKHRDRIGNWRAGFVGGAGMVSRDVCTVRGGSAGCAGPLEIGRKLGGWRQKSAQKSARFYVFLVGGENCKNPKDVLGLDLNMKIRAKELFALIFQKCKFLAGPRMPPGGWEFSPRKTPIDTEGDLRWGEGGMGADLNRRSRRKRSCGELLDRRRSGASGCGRCWIGIEELNHGKHGSSPKMGAGVIQVVTVV